MTRPLCSDAEFASLFEKHGARETGRIIGTNERNVYARRVTVEKKLGRSLQAPNQHKKNMVATLSQHPARICLEIENGVVLVGSDAHYWPGLITTAHRALVHFARELQPRAIVQNGDVLDGAGISRHPPIGWENRPELVDEVDACKARLTELEEAAPNAKRIWTLGNHDARFETRLATVAPEYARIHGVHLKDHFPFWHPCWGVWINDDVVIKHRFKSGIHAPHNNTIWAGRTMVTGHLHSLKVMPISDYNGTRWGVDTGTLAEPYGPQFTDYTELNPVSWRSGFVALTFHKGRLLWPEVVHVIGENEVEFRGAVVTMTMPGTTTTSSTPAHSRLGASPSSKRTTPSARQRSR